MKTLFILSYVLLTGCATIRSGQFAVPTADSRSADSENETKSGVVVTGSEDSSLSTPHFALVNFTFENTSRKWIKISDVELDFKDPILNKEVEFPVGERISAFAKAMSENAQVRAANLASVMGAVSLVGAATETAGLASRDRGLRLAGQLGVSTGLIGFANVAMLSTSERAKLAQAVPDTHLLSGSFEIPPGLHTKRWLLIYTENPYQIPLATMMHIRYSTMGGAQEQLALQFRSENSFSRWQYGHRRHFKGQRANQLTTASR